MSLFNKTKSKFMDMITFKNVDGGTLKTGSIILIVIILSGAARFIYFNEFIKSRGILNNFIFMLLLGLVITAFVYFILLIKETFSKNNNIVNQVTYIAEQKNALKNENINLSNEIVENSNIEVLSISMNDNIFDNKIITTLSKIIKEYRMTDKKGKDVFGISDLSVVPLTKTQLAILLSIIKGDSLFNEKYKNIGDEKFLNDFFDKIKIENITIQYFGQIKKQVMSKDEISKYEDVVIKFKDILSKELSNII